MEIVVEQQMQMDFHVAAYIQSVTLLKDLKSKVNWHKINKTLLASCLQMLYLILFISLFDLFHEASVNTEFIPHLNIFKWLQGSSFSHVFDM